MQFVFITPSEIGWNSWKPTQLIILMSLRPLGHSDSSRSYMILKKILKYFLIKAKSSSHLCHPEPSGNFLHFFWPHCCKVTCVTWPWSCLIHWWNGTFTVPAFAALMNWFLKVKIVLKKGNKILILSPLTTSFIKILGEKLILRSYSTAIWFYQIIDVAFIFL